MLTVEDKISYEQELLIIINIVTLLSICLNSFIDLFVSEMLLLSIYCFQCLLKVLWIMENIKQ